MSSKKALAWSPKNPCLTSTESVVYFMVALEGGVNLDIRV
jgi:hypothetical protein